MLEHIGDNNFEEQVLNSKGVVVVDFFATWCGPCKMLSPILEELDSEMDNVKIFKLDVDENPGVASQFGVQNIPTIITFKDGQKVDTKVGFMPKESLKESIEEVLQ